MTATGHAVLGAVIAAKIGNPYLAIPIALTSHIAADLFPHWDTGTNHKKKSKMRFFIESGIDVLVGFIIAYFVLQFLSPATDLTYAFSIIIASQFFDWATVPYLFLHMHKAPFSWIYNFQKKFDSRLDKPWGIINQIAILSLIVMLAKVL